MKKLLIAVALVVSFAAPAMADNFPNVYARILAAKRPAPLNDQVVFP